MLVAVYGTLKRGYGNNRILSESKFISECTISGFKLYDSGFPVASHSEGEIIKGELWDIGDNKETLYKLDSLEGYRKTNLPSSMYHRKGVVAETPDGNLNAQMYVGNPVFWRDFTKMRECPKEDGTYKWSR